MTDSAQARESRWDSVRELLLIISWGGHLFCMLMLCGAMLMLRSCFLHIIEPNQIKVHTRLVTLVTWYCQSSYMVKVITWITPSWYMDLSQSFCVFFALYQTNASWSLTKTCWLTKRAKKSKAQCLGSAVPFAMFSKSSLKSHAMILCFENKWLYFTFNQFIGLRREI